MMLPRHDQPSSRNENTRMTSATVMLSTCSGCRIFSMPSSIENTPPPKNKSSATMNE
jgi:hypothetical protein